MKVGDLVRIANEWAVHNPWMKEIFDVTEIGLIIKACHQDNHHCVVLIGGKERAMAKSRLELVCK